MTYLDVRVSSQLGIYIDCMNTLQQVYIWGTRSCDTWEYIKRVVVASGVVSNSPSHLHHAPSFQILSPESSQTTNVAPRAYGLSSAW